MPSWGWATFCAKIVKGERKTFQTCLKIFSEPHPVLSKDSYKRNNNKIKNRNIRSVVVVLSIVNLFLICFVCNHNVSLCKVVSIFANCT